LKLPTIVNTKKANPTLSSLLGGYTQASVATLTNVAALQLLFMHQITRPLQLLLQLEDSWNHVQVNIYHLKTGRSTASSASSFTSSTNYRCFCYYLFTPNKFTIFLGSQN
jgi:hypothetical protein